LAEDWTSSKLNWFCFVGLFYPDNNDDKLYWLTAIMRETVLYEHKNNPLYDGLSPLLGLVLKLKIKQARNITDYLLGLIILNIHILEFFEKNCRWFTIYRQTSRRYQRANI
jgi:hypothetical protein